MMKQLTKLQRRVLHRASIGKDTYMPTREAIQHKLIKRGYMRIDYTLADDVFGPLYDEWLRLTAKGREALAR